MLNPESEPFVELDRRFRKLEQKAKAEEVAIESYTLELALSGRDDSFDWNKLLNENRVVILGEPGSGKSWEFRERAGILVASGLTAFFIRLDQLVDADLQTFFDADAKRRYSKWMIGRETAYFFLDSVDEAKFGRVSDFHTALQKFQCSIGDAALARSRIYLSSRISEWQPLVDGFHFRQSLPTAPMESRVGETESKTETAKDFPLVVCLEPLNRTQVEKFAQAKGISDVTQFANALDAAFAWEFARRPLDVSDLTEFWKENHRIGSLTELIDFDVTSKLRSRSGRVELPLSDEKKREGVEWLAAASVLSRKFSFLVPDDTSSEVDSLKPLACLPATWSEDEMRALLNRAIFDSAVYGRLRFHHRRIGEYLAAKWIARRMEHGCHPLELERILSEDVRGRKTLRPALRPIAAWLCYGNDRWNEFVRDLVLETDPRIHLNYGDPANLPVDYRRQILNSLAESSKNRKRMWIDSSSDCLARIADPVIASDISTHVLNRNLADDFRIELFGIIQHGRLEACVDAAISVIAAPDESVEIKSAAVRAVGAIEKEAVLTRMYQTVSGLQNIPNSVCVAAVQALYPKTISSAELVELLKKIGPIREFGVDFPYFFTAHLQNVLTPTEAGKLLRLMLNLAETAPLYVKGDQTLEISEQFWWVGKVIPTVVEILLEKNDLTNEEVKTAAKALQFLGQFQERWHFGQSEIGDLNAKTISHVDVRQDYFWRCTTDFRAENGIEPTIGIHLFGYREVLRFQPSDFEWLVHSIKNRPAQNDRELALRVAIEMWDGSGRKFRGLWHLWSAVKNNPNLRKSFRTSGYINPLLPLRRFWWRNFRHKYGKWWWLRKFDSVRQYWNRLRGQRVLLTHLRELSSGNRCDWLNLLCHEASHGGDSWTTTSWAELEKRRGKFVARAARRGCANAWRKYHPPLPHKKEQRNTTSIGTVVGLTGLQIELGENPGAVIRLTNDEATLAACYAMDELNGFPSWFETLAVAHPTAVGRVLCECIEAEWKYPADHGDTHEVLNKIAWRGEKLIPLVREKLAALLDGGDPQNYSILRLTLSVLTQQPDTLQHLAELAPQRIAAATTIGTKALWLAVWMETEGDTAVRHLGAMLDSSSDAKEIVEHVCSLLSGEEMQRPVAVKNPSYFRPSCLRNFIPIVYRHIKFSDDINRTDGGAYTPTARDHAQRFRSILLDYLSKIESAETADVLRELADDPSMPIVGDWILNLLQQRLEKEADSEPWTPADLREFAARNEVDPKNDKELFSIALKRLLLLKWDVEQADNSLRDEVQKNAPEFHLRRWIQRKLLERSQNRYNVPQEGEIDQQERPDLRLENPKTAAVSVEVKWAENWTLEKLLERLENQLVGQYLRAHNSRFGIYLLGYIGNQQHWVESATGKKFGFEEVVGIVRQHAISLVQKKPKIAGLEVIGINFCEPTSHNPV